MLSRDAQNIYWMSRYIERARHVCRLLTDQLQAIHDRPSNEIALGWRRIFRSLNSEPTGGRLISNLEDDAFMLADAYTLVDDLAFEGNNPDAIMTCFSKARENARQVRNVISQDMWSCLNVDYLDMQGMRLQDFWEERPRDFFVNASISFDNFRGVAEVNMYRDPGWYFLQLGQFVERAMLTCSLINAHIVEFPSHEHNPVSDLESLLEICSARSSFRRMHSYEYRPVDVVEFLVADKQLPTSIAHALEEIDSSRSAISQHWNSASTLSAKRHVGRARAMIAFDWPVRGRTDNDDTSRMLTEIYASCLDFSNDIETAYFNYPLTDTTTP